MHQAIITLRSENGGTLDVPAGTLVGYVAVDDDVHGLRELDGWDRLYPADAERWVEFGEAIVGDYDVPGNVGIVVEVAGRDDESHWWGRDGDGDIICADCNDTPNRCRLVRTHVAYTVRARACREALDAMDDINGRFATPSESMAPLLTGFYTSRTMGVTEPGFQDIAHLIDGIRRRFLHEATASAATEPRSIYDACYDALYAVASAAFADDPIRKAIVDGWEDARIAYDANHRKEG